ncbi:divalent-cation tolerance protein CutA [Streptomyces sp. NPDC008238]
MAEYLEVSTATETRDQAVALARSAVSERLAAGAQIIGPVTSAFWHADAFGTGEEWKLVMTTSAGRYPALEAHVLKHHPWDNPQLSATPIVTGSEGCLRWISASTTPVPVE